MTDLRTRIQTHIINEMKRNQDTGISLLGRINDLEQEVESQLLKKCLYDMMKHEALNNPHYDPLRKILFEHLESKKREDSNYRWITFTPPEGIITKDTWEEIINKILRKKWIKDYEYVLEQRGTTKETMGQGAHIHILTRLEKAKSPAQIIREIADTLKVKPTTLTVKSVKGQSNVNNIRKYIRGQKEDDKLAAVALNTEWRQSWGLQPIYSYGFADIE